MNNILTTVMVIGAIIILLQVMILISVWRRGSKYAAMERIYRERQAEVRAKEDQRAYHRLADWNVEEDLPVEKREPFWTTSHEAKKLGHGSL